MKTFQRVTYEKLVVSEVRDDGHAPKRLRRAMRLAGAVIVGLIVAFLLVFGAEAISHQIYPPPPGMSMQDMTQVKAFVATLPLSVLLIVLAGHLIATFVATWTAAKIARGGIAGFIVGALLLAAGIVNAFMIPQPVWFSIASFVIYISATWVGARAGTAKRLAYE